MPTPSSSLSLSDVAFTWPDGTPVFDGLTATLAPGRIGVVGANGAGKSTLLRLVAGELTPGRGSITRPGPLGYLRQDIGLGTGLRVDRVLGIDAVRAALHRIEAGGGTPADFDTVGAGWDVEERAVALLARLGLGHVADGPAALDRTVGTISGGETVLLGLVAELLTEPAVLLLDEPTNNLDGVARQRLADVLGQFTGIALVVSHDRELLDGMDVTAELYRGGLRLFGGGFGEYERIVAAEQEAALAAVRDARGDLRRQRRELIETRIKLDRRVRYGRMLAETKRAPKIIANEKKRSQQVSAGKLRTTHLDRLDTAREQLRGAEEAVRDDREVRIELPRTLVHPGQEVVELTGAALPGGVSVDLRVHGPERIAVTGRNGVGKTTLLRRIAESGPKVPWKLLPQRLDVLDDTRSVFENVAAAAPHAEAQEVRAQLARFLFRGAAADAAAGTLSGGERLRAALATVLLADPAPRLLLLDEPTNNLDLPSLGHLTQALTGYRGALVVVSHDERFLAELGLTRVLRCTGTEVEELPLS
ncbi:ATP-binding cassette domain-containing protein [Nocardia asteroides]|uniref:ATP-binding cassette domain-containing protein n=1 Tax=Nocardia asteroides TaxID=1824 RepID=UPI001E5AE9E8|nr:ATP-binding cassette domain-containing protein [Nocardia asteroides]UGT63297.1 ATP-binding cassette domain-containing protein [Nocardia asteroides]